MRRFAGLLCLLCCACIPAVCFAQTGSIEADLVELDTNFATAAANGNAALTFEKVRLRADAITANRVTGDVVAVGHLALSQDGRRLQGDHLQYNFHTDEGVLTNARVVEQGVIVRGEAIEFSPDRLVARQASFTTCTKETPDYSLSADTITLTAGGTDRRGRPVSGRLALNRARINYHGRRLFSLRNYAIPVGRIQQRQATLVPTTGFSRGDGLYTSWVSSFSRPTSATSADLNLRLTTARGWRGYLQVIRPSDPFDLFAGYTRREEVRETELHEDQFTFSTADVLVDRAPECGVKVLDLPVRHSLRLRGDLRYGSYTEFDAESGEELQSANRFAVSALLETGKYPIAPTVALSGATGLRLSTYSTDDRFRIGFLRGTVAFTRSEDNRLSLSYIHRPTSGQTPFLFDAVEVRRELLGDLRYRLSPAWRMRVLEAYDLEEGRARDMSLAVTRTIHCLDYTVGWKQLSRGVFFAINLAPMPEGQAPVLP
jgi:LPS-assembly protein